jgi:hypothetical protein
MRTKKCPGCHGTGRIEVEDELPDPVMRLPGSKFRWRGDGGDLQTGSNVCGRTGGIVSWRVNPWRYTAYAYTGNDGDGNPTVEYNRDFKHQVSAQRAVERWLTKHASKGGRNARA